MINPTLASILVVGSTKIGRNQKVEEILNLKLTAQGNNPDFLLLSSLDSIGIEEIRNLQRFLQLKPFQEKRKIVFISEAQAMTEEAQNSLLKTLEEPAGDSLIILSAPDYDLLSPTIVSRCEIIQLPVESQITLSEEEISLVDGQLTKLTNSPPGERFSLAEEWGIYKDKEVALAWLDRLTFTCRRRLMARFGASKTKPSPNYPTSQLLNCLKLINQTKNYLKANCNLRLTLEVFLSNLP